MAGLGARMGGGLRSTGRAVARICTPSGVAWTAAAWALWALWAFLVFGNFFSDGRPGLTLARAIGLLALTLAMALISAGLLLAARLLAILKPRYRVALLVCLPPATLTLLEAWGPKGALIGTPVALIVLSLLFGAGAALARPGTTRTQRRGAMAFLLLAAAALALTAYQVLAPTKDLNPALAGYHLRGDTLKLADPGAPGPFGVATFTYGGGADRHRPEYAVGARFRTQSVDGSKLDLKWSGPMGWARSLYWGFGPTAMPIQGRVWAPVARAAGQSRGPYPLVLIVHGNHGMETFSDPGYAYLGQLLASQGFILVSVDENFLNSSLADEINPFDRRSGDENNARGWLHLQHLAQWRRWSEDPAHPLHGLADMTRIGLIGHSRGGEAVTAANAFNDLGHDPDDATLPFNFHFKLGAIAAIAPIDGEYKPRDRPTPMRDTNYFVIHGSMDGDVTSFRGASQYSRATFSGAVPAFKASVYVKGANHGQFNTVWGRFDDGPPVSWLFNDRQIMDPAAQRRILGVYLSAYLRATLLGQSAYRPLFEDARRGAAWLPDDYLINNFASSDTVWLANYDEDLDPDTGSTPGVALAGENLTLWRETWGKLKSADLDTQIAILGWDDRVHPEVASYHIRLGDRAASPASSLVFSAAEAGVSSLPRGFHPKTAAKPDKPGPLDWTVAVSDAAGDVATLPLSHDQALYPQVKGETRRLGFLDSTPTSEIVMRRFRFPLRDFLAANPRLDLGHLSEIRFEFDRSRRGAIALDDIGLTPGP